MASCPNSTFPIGSGNGSMPAPMTHSVPSNVKLSLTIFYLAMYFGLFIGVYIQLWLILLYNYKRFSFQTVFLFLCAFWSALRATLFSFYFNDTIIANELPIFANWLLYCFPVCLQFFTLCLLNLYFAQVMFKAKPKYAANPNNYIYPLRAFCITSVVIFLGMNISCAMIVELEKERPNVNVVRAIVVARVLINDMLFVVCAISLAYCIFKISKTTSANVLLESKGTTVCQAVSVGIVIVLLYTSRAIYNLLAISPLRCQQLSSFNFNWYNVSDQADLVNLNDDMTYVIFGIVLFIWELLPTGLTIFFFRVKKSAQSVQTSINAITPNGYSTRVYFFDNPHRYDSDEDASSSRTNSNFLHTNPQHFSAVGNSRRSPRSSVSPGRRLTHSTPPAE